jgi:hypothetical protein
MIVKWLAGEVTETLRLSQHAIDACDELTSARSGLKTTAPR